MIFGSDNVRLDDQVVLSQAGTIVQVAQAGTLLTEFGADTDSFANVRTHGAAFLRSRAHVRGDFIARNRDGDAYLEFTSVPLRDEAGANRERIRGEAWARNRVESRPISYECVLNERSNRVLSSSYEVLPRGRVGYAR